MIMLLGQTRLGGYLPRRDIGVFHKMPLMFNNERAGIVDILQSDEVGLWYEAQLDMGNRYLAMIRRLVTQEQLRAKTNAPDTKSAMTGIELIHISNEITKAIGLLRLMEISAGVDVHRGMW